MIKLAAKPDYPEVLSRFEAWWRSEPLDRPQCVWFWPMGVYSRAEAEDFIAWTARWAAGQT